MKDKLNDDVKRASKRKEIAIYSIEDFSKEVNKVLHQSLNDKMIEISSVKDELEKKLSSIKDEYTPLLMKLNFELDVIRKNTKKAIDELKSEACLRLKVKEEHINLIMKTNDTAESDTGNTAAESINQ